MRTLWHQVYPFSPSISIDAYKHSLQLFPIIIVLEIPTHMGMIARSFLAKSLVTELY